MKPAVLAVIAVGLVAAQAALAADKHPFNVEGTYVEGCSCRPPCACALISVEKGCQGLGAMEISAGDYKGADLKGVKIAMALSPEKWVRVYLDVPDAKQHEGAAEFAK